MMIKINEINLMRIALVQFPNSSSAQETKLAIQRAGMEPVEVSWHEIEKLSAMDGYIIVGSASSKDRIQAGMIAPFDPMLWAIKQESDKGKPVLGICHGAQVLVESGMVPGLKNNKVGIALIHNQHVIDGNIVATGFNDAWVHIRLHEHYQRNAFTRHLTPNNTLHLPIAHSEGRFVMSEILLDEITAQGLSVFQYCSEAGEIIEQFPINPNGSMKNIAAISNKAGNVMAILPRIDHAESGDAIFHSMRDYIVDSKARPETRKHTIPLYYYPRRPKTPMFERNDKTQECFVELVATDQYALTVQQRLQQLGFSVTVKRQTHWEVQTHFVDVIKQNGILFDEKKECIVDKATTRNTLAVLVRNKEDHIGHERLQALKLRSITDVDSISHGVLWYFTPTDANHPTDLLDQIIDTNLIYHPSIHVCFKY